MATQAPEVCPGCGIPPGKKLTPEEYLETWRNSPELHLALRKNAEVSCPECGRKLTYDRNRYPGPRSPKRSQRGSFEPPPELDFL